MCERPSCRMDCVDGTTVCECDGKIVKLIAVFPRGSGSLRVMTMCISFDSRYAPSLVL